MLTRSFAKLTGHPSISLPFDRITGLPVALQLTAALGQDAGLFSIARAIANSAEA